MNNQEMTLYAAAAFGLEGLIGGELKRLNMQDIHPENGGVRFSGDLKDAYLCNLRLRFSDRVYILMAESECLSFDALFRLVSSVAWESWLRGTEKLLISAQCVRSRLMSPRDCQAIAKKALIERLKRRTGRKIFPETDSDFSVHIQIHKDRTRILLNTSGPSLSRRGYRTWNGEAPIRETLASALVEMSPWRPGIPLCDPCCGTGTLLIEAAMRQAHFAPGMNRHFDMEYFLPFSTVEAEKILYQTRKDFEPQKIFGIRGSDIDPGVLDLARRHEKQATLGNHILWNVLPLQKIKLEEDHGVFLCNPPYGERLGDVETCRLLYSDLGALQRRHPGWSLCAISSDPGFERAYGKRADKIRRVYNGRLECQFYIFSPVLKSC